MDLTEATIWVSAIGIFVTLIASQHKAVVRRPSLVGVVAGLVSCPFVFLASYYLVVRSYTNAILSCAIVLCLALALAHGYRWYLLSRDDAD